MGTPPVEMQCYDLEGFKGLLKLDAQLVSADQMKELLFKKVSEMDQIQQNQQEQLQLLQQSSLVLQTENTRLFTAWKDENKRRLELEHRPSSPLPWLPWAIAGAAASVALALGTVLVLK